MLLHDAVEDQSARLTHNVRERPAREGKDKELLLLALLDRLVLQGELGSSDTIKASLDTLKTWLGQECIPYKQFFI